MRLLYVRSGVVGSREVNAAADVSVIIDDGRVKAPAVLDVAAHLIGRVKLQLSMVPNEAFGRPGFVPVDVPVLQLEDDGRGFLIASTEDDQVAPRCGRRQPILDGD